MIKTILAFLFVMVFFSSCSFKDEKPMVISTNAWIGYSPLFYAREMGWLKEENIELISVVSLGESMHLYNAGTSDAFTGTQHEFFAQREMHPDLIPIMLMDKSFGGDAVLSNLTLNELQKTDKKINVFLELDSINHDLLNYFIEKNGIPKEKLIIHNQIQDEIKLIKLPSVSNPVLIVTYDPYNFELIKNGFQELATTQNNSDLFVVDAIYVSSEFFETHREQFIRLRLILNRAISVLHNNPKHYYETVKAYLDNPTYDEFIHMNNNIIWLSKNIEESDRQKMAKIQFPIKDVIP